jgi:actin-related protein
MYSIGADTGIVVESGFLNTTILPINYSRPIGEGITTMSIGGCHIDHYVRDTLLDELKGHPEEEKLSNLITSQVIEDVKIRACFVPSRK